MSLKSEIRISKHETNPKIQNPNTRNKVRFEHWNIRVWNLFRISSLGFRILVLVLLTAPFLLPLAHAQDADGKFKDANTSYRTGDFEKAAKLYRELTLEHPKAAVFFYDLGNAYVKLGKLSEAILAYEKALRLSPRDKDARHNLSYAHGLLEYRVEDNRNWYLKAADAVLSRYTQREINFGALAVVFIFLMSGMLFFIFRQNVFWDSGRKFLIVFVILFAGVAFWKHVQTDMISDAIVMEKECEVRYGPSEHDQVAFRVGEGIKASIMDRREDWSRVLLTNGESGWIRNSAISEVTV